MKFLSSVAIVSLASDAGVRPVPSSVGAASQLFENNHAAHAVNVQPMDAAKSGPAPLSHPAMDPQLKALSQSGSPQRPVSTLQQTHDAFNRHRSAMGSRQAVPGPSVQPFTVQSGMPPVDVAGRRMAHPVGGAVQPFPAQSGKPSLSPMARRMAHPASGFSMQPEPLNPGATFSGLAGGRMAHSASGASVQPLPMPGSVGPSPMVQPFPMGAAPVKPMLFNAVAPMSMEPQGRPPVAMAPSSFSPDHPSPSASLFHVGPMPDVLKTPVQFNGPSLDTMNIGGSPMSKPPTGGVIPTSFGGSPLSRPPMSVSPMDAKKIMPPPPPSVTTGPMVVGRSLRAAHHPETKKPVSPNGAEMDLNTSEKPSFFGKFFSTPNTPAPTPKQPAQKIKAVREYMPTSAPRVWNKIWHWVSPTTLPHTGPYMDGISKPEWKLSVGSN